MSKAQKAALAKGQTIAAATRKGMSKTKARKLYDAGLLTRAGEEKKPTAKKKAATKKKVAKRKTAKKRAKTAAKKATQKRSGAVKAAAARKSKRGQRQLTYTYGGETFERKSGRTKGKSLRKKGSPCYKKDTRPVRRQAGAELAAGDGTKAALVRWCRNYMNLSVAECDL
jgi:hypothetical protein